MKTLVVILMLVSCPSFAHDDAEWIQKAHPGCCGPQDCFKLPKGFAKEVKTGWMVNWRGKPFVFPFETALPSDDEDFWLCEFASTTREPRPACFFAPPAGI